MAQLGEQPPTLKNIQSQGLTQMFAHLHCFTLVSRDWAMKNV